MSATLRKVWAAAQAQAAATDLLIAAVREAMAEPDRDVAAIAREAGVTRQTVYRWSAADGRRTVVVRDALDDALRVVASGLDHHAAADVTRGVGQAPDVQIRRLRLGLSNLAGAPTEAEREVTSLATAVADAAERAHERSGKWPRTVVIASSPQLHQGGA